MASFIMWTLVVTLLMLAWGAWESGGERLIRPEQDQPGHRAFRVTGLFFAVMAIVCARLA